MELLIIILFLIVVVFHIFTQYWKNDLKDFWQAQQKTDIKSASRLEGVTLKNSTQSKRCQPLWQRISIDLNWSLFFWQQVEPCHLESSNLLSPRLTIPLHVLVSLHRLRRRYKQAILFWNQEMLFLGLNFFTLITSASQNIKNIENQELSKANQLRWCLFRD